MTGETPPAEVPDGGPPSGGRRPGLAARLGRQTGKRLLEAVVFLFLLVTALFFLLRLNGNPAAVLAGPGATPEQVSAVEKLYGLNHPLIVQYGLFMKKFLLLQFGNSLTAQTSALTIAVSHAWKTIFLCLLATVVNVVIATPMGLYLGRRNPSRLHRAARWAVLVAQGVQYYVVGILLVAVLAVHFKVFPATGVTKASGWVLPTLALAWLAAPRLTRVVASAAQEVWESDYVRAASAFGLRPGAVWWKTVAPNVAVPLIATAGTQFTLLISGAVIIEGLFGIPGIGQALVHAVGNSDFPVVAAGVTVIGVIVFVVTTLTDVLYQIVDPRLRRQGT